MPKTHVVKWGKNLAVRIPRAVAEEAHFKQGDLIVIEALEGRIELRPAERIETLEELVAQITKENCPGETDWGPDRGKEIGRW